MTKGRRTAIIHLFGYFEKKPERILREAPGVRVAVNSASQNFALNVELALKQAGEYFQFEMGEAAPCAQQLERIPADAEFSDISVKGSYVAAEETVFVRGRATARVRTRCARCLAAVERVLEADIHENFGRAEDANDSDDEDRNVFSGYVIDIAECVYSSLLLNLPIRELCRADCKGLCPICGADRNNERCSCQA